MKRKNKKGQAESIIYFFVVAFILFMMAPLLLEIPIQIFAKLQPVAGNMSTQAGTSVGYINTKMTSLWDEMIVILFMGNIGLLFLTAFLIDVHPVFVIIYIGALAFIFIFAMPVWSVLNEYYSTTILTDATSVMPMTKLLVDNFPIVLLVVAILSGVIMYAKIKYFGKQSGY